MRNFFTRFLPIVFSLVAVTPLPGEIIAPAGKIDLLADPDFTDFALVLHNEKSLVTKREEVFKIENGVLRVSGRAVGYLRTAQDYRDYHLVLEYKWGEHTWSGREDKARDGGAMVHGHGADATYGGTWIASFNIQLLEGGTGDMAILGGLAGTAVPPTSITVEGENPRELKNGRKMVCWKKGGSPLELTSGTSEWSRRDPDWLNVKGFRGKNDIENPVGEWNRLEVICAGDRISVKLNGQLVNEGGKASPAEGKVCLQTEGSEYWVRRFELWPLNAFTEEYAPDPTSDSTGDELLPRRFPLNAEASMATFELDGDYRLELVAAEPLVCDPVDIAFDEKGRVYVAEMRDYPLPPEHGPLLSRIRLLKDTDGDGRMDEVANWATGLDHVQGLLPMQGGLLVTTRTAILFLRDSNGDDVADDSKILFLSNNPRHSQVQVSSPRWGLDNGVYLNNGLDGKEIYPAGQIEKKMDIAKRNLRFDPRTGELTAVSGYGQFGAAQDDWGRRFFCSNRKPVMFSIMPLRAVERNPFAGLREGHEDIALSGGEATVYPALITHTTSAAHHGTRTAACGLGVYRGDLMPDLRGNIFVAEPPRQLVARSVIEPRGASLWAERKRLEPRTEFLRSSDEWARPVNIRNGPDGALYVCDMYRRFIDHARFFPEEFNETTYMRAGFDQGRIYRVIPVGRTPPRDPGRLTLPESAEGLVKVLAHPNSWHRETAQRLLVEKNDASVVPVLEDMMNNNETDSRGRVHALWTIEGLGKLEAHHVQAALADPEPGVVENALELVERFVEKKPGILLQLLKLTRHESRRVRMLTVIALGTVDDPAVTNAMAEVVLDDPEDRWLRDAVLSGSEKRAGEILKLVFADGAFCDAPQEADAAAIEEADAAKAGRATLVRSLAEAIAARGDVRELAIVFDAIGSANESGRWWQLAAVKGLADGLQRHDGANFSHKTLASLLANPPDELVAVTAATGVLVDDASWTMVNPEGDLEERLAAVPLLAHMPPEKILGTFARLVVRQQPAVVQEAAFNALSRFDRNKLTDFFFERWAELGPVARREAITAMMSNSKTAQRLMEKMKAGEINPALMDPVNRSKYQRSKNPELQSLARKLWEQPSEDRRAVLDGYREVLAMKGDVARGKEVFAANCAVCHTIDGEGLDVGPDISDVRNKTPDAVLSDILDPNRVVESRWMAHAIETRDGRTLTGIVVSESVATLEIRGLGVSETLARGEIESVTCLDLSTMPVGLEAAINKQQMADLLAFLRLR